MTADDQNPVLSDNNQLLDDEQTRIEPVARREAAPTPAASVDNVANQPLAGAREQLQIGDLLKDRFRIDAKLGEGGMGMVFKAIDQRKVEARSHNPYIAIKVLHPSLARNQVLVAGLQRECEKAQQLSHPNIITVFDFDRDGDYVFMSMEYLSGQPLNKIIRDAALGGGIKLAKAWPIIQQMAKALAYAHRRGIVHSDFKPANAFVTDDHEVKVLDFGIAAKIDHGTDPDATVFNARAEGGLTPPYASFEMINGAKADPRDDIYAFGLVVYEMLTGKHPYQRKPASTVFIEQQRGNKINLEPVPGLSRRQWQVLKASIELLQEKRPKNLDDWLKEFAPQSRFSAPQWLGIAASVSLLAISVLVNRWLDQSNESKPQAVGEVKAVKQPVLIPAVAPASASLPQAKAGDDQQGQVGQAVRLNGADSASGDGQALSFNWRWQQTPLDSNVQLQGADTATPQFTPDKPGEYIAELQVRDGHNASAPALVRVLVQEVAKPVLSYQTISDDGVLQLAVGKARYRIGEKLRVNVEVAKAGYLRVAYIGSTGEVSEILPNESQGTKVTAKSKLQIPPKNAKFELKITGPVGNDKIVALFGNEPLNNLESIVDGNGDMAGEHLKNNSMALVQYAVAK